MILDKFIRYRIPTDDDLTKNNYNDLMNRYNYLKNLAAEVSQENREKYDKTYRNLLDDIDRYYIEMKKRQAATPRKSDPQIGNYRPKLYTDTLENLEHEALKAYEEYRIAMNKLTTYITKQIKDRIMEIFTKADRHAILGGGFFEYIVNLPFAIKLKDDYYDIFCFRHDPKNDVMALDLRRGLADKTISYPLTGEAIVLVYNNLYRMGFWDDNYTFEIGE